MEAPSARSAPRPDDGIYLRPYQVLESNNRKHGLRSSGRARTAFLIAGVLAFAILWGVHASLPSRTAGSDISTEGRNFHSAGLTPPVAQPAVALPQSTSPAHTGLRKSGASGPYEELQRLTTQNRRLAALAGALRNRTKRPAATHPFVPPRIAGLPLRHA